MGRVTYIAAAAGLSFFACRLAEGGLGGAGDAGRPDDAAETDAVASDAGDDGSEGGEGGCTPESCAGACCGDTCMSQTCAECSVGGHFCPSSSPLPGGNCVSDCASCTTFSGAATCYVCGDAGLSASCAASSAACPGDLAAGACPCPSGTAEECPGPEQTCSMVDGAFVCLSP